MMALQHNRKNNKFFSSKIEDNYLRNLRKYKKYKTGKVNYKKTRLMQKSIDKTG